MRMLLASAGLVTTILHLSSAPLPLYSTATRWSLGLLRILTILKMTDEDFRRFLEAAFGNYRSAIKRGASLYVCRASLVQRDFQNAIEAAGFEVRLSDYLGEEHFRVGLRPLQIPTRTNFLLPC